MNKKIKIAIHAYGGTIAQIKDNDNVLRSPKDSKEFQKACLEYLGVFQENISFIFHTPVLIDSSNARAIHWQVVIEELNKIQSQVDAQIVIFGTDTLAYLANAIQLVAPFHLYTPIIVTGAQQPLYEPGSDGLKNLIDAVKGAQVLVNHGLSGQHFIGCVVAFGDRYINSSTVSKISARKRQGFDAPIVHEETEGIPFKPGILGKNEVTGAYIDLKFYDDRRVLSHSAYNTLKHNIEVQKSLDFNHFIIDGPADLYENKTRDNAGISLITVDFNPDLNPRFIKFLILDKSVSILVIRGVGDGHIGSYWLDMLRLAIEEGVTVFIHSPFFDGKAGTSSYEIAVNAEKIGILPTFGMTRSMLYVKTKWLLATGQVTNYSSYVEKLLENCCDEILLTSQQSERIKNRIFSLKEIMKEDRIQSNLNNVSKSVKLWGNLMQKREVLYELGFTDEYIT